MTIPVILVWLAIIVALLMRRGAMWYLFNGTIAFGGMTLLPPTLTGGLNLPAQTVCAILLLTAGLADKDIHTRMALWALDFRKLGALAAFGVFGALTALILPRIFAGSILVYSLNAAASKSPLSPTSANISQTIYLFVSIGMVFVVAAYISRPGFLRRYLNTVVVAGLLLSVSGAIDFAFGAVGREDMLAGFHNASYNLLDNEMIAGTKRIVGFMPEASVYGQACCFILSFLLFNYHLYTGNIRRYALPCLIGALVALTIESTSSTGYVGLFIIGSLQALRLLVRVSLTRWAGRRGVITAQYFIGALPIVCLIVFIIPMSFWTHLQSLINLMVFQKTETGSYAERSAWTNAGWAAFQHTDWFGAGIGSVRTSNWFANLVASTGIIGAILFAVFALGAIVPTRHPPDASLQQLRNGVLLSLIPAAAMIAASGTTPDPGVWIMSLFGILYGIRLNAVPSETISQQRRFFHETQGSAL